MSEDPFRVARINPGIPKTRSTVVRFLEKVEIREGATACWLWQGEIDKTGGYPAFRHPDTKWAHRASYLLFVGPIPDGDHVDHLCENRKCVKPDHLEAVTPLTNTQRAHTFRWTSCDDLHPTSPTRVGSKRGRLRCLECHVIYERRRRARASA